MNKNRNDNHLLRIRNTDDLSVAITQLCNIDPQLCSIIDALPEVPLRFSAPGFEGLAEIITGQQVSKASATAIFSRLQKLIDPLDAQNLLAAGEAPLIKAGLSRAKQTTLTGLAHAIDQNKLDLEALCNVPVDSAINQLTALKGIGPWTAEVFLLFCAGHADIFPAGDVALQHAVADVLEIPEKPDAKTTRILAARWAPMRSIASRVLYAHYAFIRNQNNIPV